MEEARQLTRYFNPPIGNVLRVVSVSVQPPLKHPKRELMQTVHKDSPRGVLDRVDGHLVSGCFRVALVLMRLTFFEVPSPVTLKSDGYSARN